MEQRYIFTILAFIGNMVNLFGRASLRIGVLAIRAEFEACLVNSTLNKTEEDCGPIIWDDSSVADKGSGESRHRRGRETSGIG